MLFDAVCFGGWTSLRQVTLWHRSHVASLLALAWWLLNFLLQDGCHLAWCSSIAASMPLPSSRRLRSIGLGISCSPLKRLIFLARLEYPWPRTTLCLLDGAGHWSSCDVVSWERKQIDQSFLAISFEGPVWFGSTRWKVLDILCFLSQHHVNHHLKLCYLDYGRPASISSHSSFNMGDLEFDLSRSLKVKSKCAVGLPIYDFLLVSNSKSYMGSLTAPLDLTLSDLERSNSRSPTFQFKVKVTQILKPYISRRSSGPMLPLTINRKPYMASPMTPWHLTLSDPERSKSRSLTF